jgi:5-(carboxyamino)imidazole ribonucleotide synthase
MKKLGILGGGQLGRMLLHDAINLGIDIAILDPDPECSCATWCKQFTCGDFRDYQTVMDWGKDMDIITIEIEQVNVKALLDLRDQGKAIHPNPDVLAIIQDKGLQKEYYKANHIPTAPYRLFEDKESIIKAYEDGEINLPFVQKSRTEGYDGKGVSIIRTEQDLESKLLPKASVVEELADIDKEIAVIAVRDGHNPDQIRTFTSVEMLFHPEANLLEFQLCPAEIPASLEQQAHQLAEKTLQGFDMMGVLAVEMFVLKSGEIWINEVAPRPHNSGHHTIESFTISQYGAHLRSVLGWPVPQPEIQSASALLNLLGDKDHQGPVYYQGLEECLALSGVSVHLYGKKITKPYRKMGHVTVTGHSKAEIMTKARTVEHKLKVVSKS